LLFASGIRVGIRICCVTAAKRASAASLANRLKGITVNNFSS